jgi:fructose-bisphosphate aldolase class II
MQAICAERMTQFGQAGKAPGVPVVSLAQMAADYAAGKYGENAKPDAAWKAHKGKGGGKSAMGH